MVPRLAIFVLAALAASPLPAAEVVSFTTLDGQSFQNVTVQRIQGRRMEVATPAGVKSLRYPNLPREMQERFFDPSMLYPPKVGDTLDFKTADGTHFKGPLREISPTGISIETDHGVSSVPFAKLPVELANTFNYDPEDAARYEAALRAQRAQALAAQQAAERKLASERAARERQKPRDPAPRPAAAMGDRGSKNLGTPQLGGQGLRK